MMTTIYLFEDPDEYDSLVLHMPTEPGSMISVCGVAFGDDDLYLPDTDQAIADFCPQCQPAWVEARTSNINEWRFT